MPAYQFRNRESIISRCRLQVLSYKLGLVSKKTGGRINHTGIF